ncbi:MAG: hypothetical protein KKI08_05260 [Armatimonadetes bacterium]|nr:hypothetical protein [Armatimonadota bacterium]
MKAGWLVLSVGVVVIVALIGGCAGHGGQAPPDGGPAAAAFVGRAVCATCHAGANTAFGAYNGVAFVPGTTDPSHVYANFTGSAHGQDMRSKGPGNRNVQDNPGCVACHVVGSGEATGYTSAAATPHLEGIGCEECHGKGSVHAGTPSSSNITKWPDASTTCWDCHAGSYKYTRAGQPSTVTDDNPTLYGALPSKVRAHQRQAPFLNGYLGYGIGKWDYSPHLNVPNTCVSCHLSEGSSSHHGRTALQVDFDACVGCHAGGEAAAEQMLEDFEDEINDLLIELGGDDGSGAPNATPIGGLIHQFAVLHSIDDGTPETAGGITDPDNAFVKAYKAARYNFDHVEASGAWHNPPFAEKLLADAKALVD